MARDCKVLLPSTGLASEPVLWPTMPQHGYGGESVDSLEGRTVLADNIVRRLRALADPTRVDWTCEQVNAVLRESADVIDAAATALERCASDFPIGTRSGLVSFEHLAKEFNRRQQVAAAALEAWTIRGIEDHARDHLSRPVAKSQDASSG